MTQARSKATFCRAIATLNLQPVQRFPTFPSPEIIPSAVERAAQIGTSQSLREFEDWLKQTGLISAES
ncbi:hypothetical protein [Thermoleptolyngbya oregonensis]|uniref:hypothetical protein n=1 Tax=Thermoleptolyngbya oregonensis TaxID=2303529 RepID=UPI00292F1290|nr:hypothetical protein [Thermoleptolyngbya oregonensis]